MLHTEYVRSLNCNYERILLDTKPEEKRYQYCILSRGGIKGLLPCSLRYIDGLAYLYYDISSRQNVSQLFHSRTITREWVSDFMWSFRQTQQELGRFLLDIGNIIWYPEHIFQELESNLFSFTYIPYYGGEESFIKLIEFWVEHIDYDDEVLVDCVYHMYEQLERNGAVYLQARIFEDVKCLEEKNLEEKNMKEKNMKEKKENTPCVEEKLKEAEKEEIAVPDSDKKHPNDRKDSPISQMEGKAKADYMPSAENCEIEERTGKKGIFSIFENRRNRSRKLREEYSVTMHQEMSGYAVAEDVAYDTEDYGRTVFMEDKQDSMEKIHGLYTPEGRLLASIDKSTMSIGKKKEEVDCVLEDTSVSRIHARITDDKGDIYLEDLNSTNGTFKNGLRMQPYEKRKLETGDEIKCGKVILIFR